MVKVLFTSIGLFTLVLAYGQREINNSTTEDHKQIPGTKFFIVPPTGFVAATSFQGFQQINSGASILVIEIPGPFSESIKGFTEQGLKTRGMVLQMQEEINLNGYQGLLLTAEQFAHGTNYSKYILVFGDSNATYMVNGTFPEEFEELEKDVRESILSVVYESELMVDPLSAVAFTVDTRNTKLNFAKNLTGTLIYTVDGEVPTASNDKTSFIVGHSLVNIHTIDKKLTALNRIKRMPYTDLEIDESEITSIDIDGISGYEIIGEGLEKSNGAKELVYQVMLFTDDGYYILLGTTKSDFEENLQLFRKVARSFRRK